VRKEEKLAGIDLKSVPNMVQEAIKDCLREENKLLMLEVNERSVTHKIAEYLQKKFCNSGYDVDCEYNKDGHEPKQVHLPRELVEGSVSTSEDMATTVYPDIIIHRRGTSDNLVVIEAKKSRNPDKNMDLRKLIAFRKDLGYKFCYRLVFDAGERVNPENPNYRLEEIK
jgi:hypothetical protein